jgi:preprotein translocase subunit SecA
VRRLAIILAVWSLQKKAKNFNDIQLNNEEGESIDINPHPVQVAALLLLTTKQQDSQLVQILTGEGKSIVLATLAIYIAKKDETPVVVSCYSSYLCQRDSKNFQSLFAKFNVGHLIAYHTFN